ncbi:MAG: nucleotide exchange factor GrpE [Oscillospiraceae bacterium]|nr:nucleotide exchange factor GrpE [Oscillospiraceae bacterium]
MRSKKESLMMKEQQTINEQNEEFENIEEEQTGDLENEVIEEKENDNSNEIDKLINQIEELNKSIADLKDKDLRLKAEFDNYRKRTIREKEELYESAKADCILPFLSILDNLERALNASENEDKLSEGVKMIVAQFTETLNKIGVTEIKSEGETFDPNCHNAINTVEDDNYDHNIICQVFQKGYKLGENVIRHAMVVVANP